MQEYNRVLLGTDKAVFNLRALYGSFGYKKYRMSKFARDTMSNSVGFCISNSNFCAQLQYTRK